MALPAADACSTTTGRPSFWPSSCTNRAPEVSLAKLSAERACPHQASGAHSASLSAQTLVCAVQRSAVKPAACLGKHPVLDMIYMSAERRGSRTRDMWVAPLLQVIGDERGDAGCQ